LRSEQEDSRLPAVLLGQQTAGWRAHDLRDEASDREHGEDRDQDSVKIVDMAWLDSGQEGQRQHGRQRAASSAAPASGSAERGPHTSGGSGRKDQGLAGEERLGPGWVAGWGAPLGTTLSSGSTFQITIQPARHTLKNVCQ